MLAGAILLGMDHAEGGLRLADPTPEHTPIPFEEAIQFLKARVSLTKAEWAALEPKLAFRAFTLAKLTQCDYIEAVRGRLVTALEKGEGFEQLWNDIKGIAESDGATIKPGYWETVYRTNIQTSYNAGRRMQFDRSPPAALALMVLEDERTSDICRPLAGLVLPYDHPFWEDHWPPFHFNCRTTVRGIYEDEVGRIPSENVPMSKLRKEFKPQAGFGENPLQKQTFWKLTQPMLDRIKKYELREELRAFAKAIGFNYDPVIGSTLVHKEAIVHVRPITGNIAETREKVKEYLESLKGSIFYNEQIKGPIVVTNNGIRKAISLSGDPKKLSALFNLPELLEKMTIIEAESDKDNNPNVIEVIKSKIVVEIEKQKHIFNIILKHLKPNTFQFYDISTYTIK